MKLVLFDNRFSIKRILNIMVWRVPVDALGQLLDFEWRWRFDGGGLFLFLEIVGIY